MKTVKTQQRSRCDDAQTAMLEFPGGTLPKVCDNLQQDTFKKGAKE